MLQALWGLTHPQQGTQNMPIGTGPGIRGSNRYIQNVSNHVTPHGRNFGANPHPNGANFTCHAKIRKKNSP